MQVTIEQAAKEAVDFPEAKGLVPSHRLPRESWLHARRFAICRLGATNP
jgi:hypothetical protein